MLVCNVSQRPARAAIAADIAEAAQALDASTLGYVIFATLVDDPASVAETVDAYLGEIMLEAASAADAPDAAIPGIVAADVVEAATAADAPTAALGSNEAAVFLARTSGLNTTHTNAYTALIDGLVADGIWAKLDALYIFATQDATTAQLNLISASYPATLNGSPTFTADRGYAGVLNSSTVYINTGFNPTTAPSPKFTQNSAHISFWSTSNTGQNYNFPIGFNNAGATFLCGVLPNTTEVGGSTYYRINGPNSGGFGAAGTGFGHYIGTRTGSFAVQGYKNGASHATDSPGSVTIPSLNIYVLGQNNNGAAIGDSRQITMASIGSSFSSTDATNYYNRLRTYMTAVGVLATFDGTATGVTLSNGNLTATHTNTSSAQGARSTANQSSGKYYFEVTVGATHGGGDNAGILLSTGTYTDMTNGQNCCVAFLTYAFGAIYSNNTNPAAVGSSFAAGDIMRICIDLTARKAWFSKNNTNIWNNRPGVDDPVTGASIVTIASGSFAPALQFGSDASAVGDNMTANFGGTPFTYTPPTGFGNWPA